MDGSWAAAEAKRANVRTEFMVGKKFDNELFRYTLSNSAIADVLCIDGCGAIPEFPILNVHKMPWIEFRGEISESPCSTPQQDFLKKTERSLNCYSSHMKCQCHSRSSAYLRVDSSTFSSFTRQFGAKSARSLANCTTAWQAGDSQ